MNPDYGSLRPQSVFSRLASTMLRAALSATLLGAIQLAAAEIAPGFDLTEGADVMTFSADLTKVQMSKTGAEVVGVAYRPTTDAAWRETPLHIAGLRRETSGTSNSTASETPTIRYVVRDGHLIIKCEVQQDGLFWNLWMALESGSRNIEMGRFVYGEGSSLNLRGVGIQFAASGGYAFDTQTTSYSAVGGSHSGGYLDLSMGDDAWRIYVSNMDAQIWEETSDEAIVWCRSSTTNWSTKIDYRRIVLVPAETGESFDDLERFDQLRIFDRPMTNVELVGSWIVRSKNSSGSTRDWFNASNHSNSFIPGTGSSYVTKVGFWRDDWTTGGVSRGLKWLYDVTGDPFYFMRFSDIVDYQMDHAEDRVKSQWGINNAWQENYPMGRIESAVDVYDLTGWEYYRDAAASSVDWFFTYEDFVPGEGHSTLYNIDYLDMSYCFEGLYRADVHNGNKWRQVINDYYRNVDRVTWNSADNLFGHNLGGGLDDHWARGHGWWFQTHSNIMDFYDGDDAEDLREHYSLAVTEAISLQDGIWHKTLDNPSTFLDASAGTMMASGMANSFLRGELGPDALDSAMEAISYLTEERLQTDGTLTGTDRGSSSNDPFPYTQEGYVHFARDVGIAEIVELASRDTLVTTFAEGVMITDETGGKVTDANGDVITVDGRIIIDELTADKSAVRLLGVGSRLVAVEGFEADRTYTVTDQAASAGEEQTVAVTASASGVLELDLVLSGEHFLSLTPRTAGTIWAGNKITETGFFWLSGMGWSYDKPYPYVWMANVGWTFIAPDATLESTWLYDFSAGGWRWTNSTLDGWYYDTNTGTWGRYGT